MTFYEFSSEGTNQKFRLIECPYMDYYRVPSNECSSYRESTGVLTLSAKLFDNNNIRRFFRFLILFLFIFFFGKALKKVLMSFLLLQLGWSGSLFDVLLVFSFTFSGFLFLFWGMAVSPTLVSSSMSLTSSKSLRRIESMIISSEGSSYNSSKICLYLSTSILFLIVATTNLTDNLQGISRPPCGEQR